ncbi:MAG: glycosyltransferase family 4 protein [Terriglobia bacterium]
MLHNRYLSRGGEDESTDLEIRLLREHGHEVDLYEADNREIGKRSLIRTGVDAIWSSTAYRAVRHRISQNPCDVVHVQNFFPLLSPAVCYAARAEGKPVVQSLRNYRLLCLNGLFFRDGGPCEDCLPKSIPWPGVLHRCYRDSRSGSSAVAAMLVVHRLLQTWHRQVAVFVALSEFARTKLVEGGLPEHRIVVKPNAVHPDPGSGKLDRDYVLLVSRLVPEKGVLLVFEAWRRMRAPKPLKVVGDGPLLSELREFVDVHRLSEVEVLGRVAHGDVLTLMKGARFLIFPSLLYETFGRVAVEAFACGVPVISSRLGAIAEIVEERRTGLHFEPGNVEDLAGKVEWAWSHPNEMAVMGRSARFEYERKYSAERNLDMLMEIYHRAIGAIDNAWPLPRRD